MRYRTLLPRLNKIRSSSGLLRGIWWFETDVSGLPVGRIFKDQADHSRRVMTLKTEEIDFISIDIWDVFTLLGI
jgi:hypothetical protein